MKQTLGPRIFGGVDNEAGLGWTLGEEEEAWSCGLCRGVDKIMEMEKNSACVCLLAWREEGWKERQRRGGKNNETG
jgi:hypothetical protein